MTDLLQKRILNYNIIVSVDFTIYLERKILCCLHQFLLPVLGTGWEKRCTFQHPICTLHLGLAILNDHIQLVLPVGFDP